MTKLALFPILLAATCVVAGLYGAIHNQISYTVAPDYFFAFKFHQFDIPDELHNRLGAAVVGWYASWWMGLIIGIPVLLTGLVLPDAKTYLKHALLAFVVVACTALSVGLCALAVGYFTISEQSLPRFWYPPGVINRVAFARAGNMHNFSYLGGGIGILTGAGYLIMTRLRLTKSQLKSTTLAIEQ